MLLSLLLPGLVLALYFLASIRLFGGDRIAEIFDSSRTVSAALSGQIHSELTSWLEEVRLVASDVDSGRGTLGEFGKQLVRRSAKLNAIWVMSEGESAGQARWVDFRKDSWMALNVEPLRDRFPDLLHAALADRVAIKLIDLAGDERFACHALALCKPVALVATVLGEPRAGYHKYAVAVLDAAELTRIFGETPALKAHLVNSMGLSVLSSDPFAESAAMDFSTWAFFKKLKTKGFREGAEETVSESDDSVLVSYSPVGMGNLSVISLSGKSAALRAMRVPLWRSALYGIALLALAAAIGVFTSRWVARPAEA